MISVQELTTTLVSLHTALSNDHIDPASFQKAESLLAILAHQYGYDLDEKDDMILSFEQCSINKLAELENKIKQVNPISAIQEQTNRIIETLRSFWKEAGFNYLSDIKMNMNGVIDVKFRFSLDYGSVLSSNASRDREKSQALKERLIEEGYQLDSKKKNLVDCDVNKVKIASLILERIPSAKIASWNSSVNYPSEEMILEELSVYIRNPEDIIR